MGICRVCGKNLENDETRCPDCGFEVKLPVFLSEEQYVEWSTDVVFPYMNEYLQKKTMKSQEILDQAKKLAEKAAKDLAGDLTDKSLAELVSHAVSELAAGMKEQSRKHMVKGVETVFSGLKESSETFAESGVNEYVVHLAEGTSPRREAVVSRSPMPKTEPVWAPLKQTALSRINSSLDQVPPKVQADVQKAVQKDAREEFEQHILPEVIAVSENLFREKGYSEEQEAELLEEIQKESRDGLKDAEESALENIRAMVRTQTEQVLASAFAEEERKFSAMTDELVKNRQREIESGEILKSNVEENTMCAFGLDFYVTFHEKSVPALDFVGDNMMLGRSLGKWGKVTAIAAGDGHVTGLTPSGMVLADGNNNLDQCDTRGWKNIVQVAACGANTAALDKSGKVYVCGADEELQDAKNWNDIQKIALGTHHILGLKKDGTVVAAGDNDDEQCDVGSWNGIVDIAAGEYHSLGVTSQGTVVAAGSSLYGECETADWKNIKTVRAGNGMSAGLTKDGKVIFCGEAVEIRELKETERIVSFELSQSGEPRCYYKTK